MNMTIFLEKHYNINYN